MAKALVLAEVVHHMDLGFLRLSGFFKKSKRSQNHGMKPI
jgi:hypothetical protein